MRPLALQLVFSLVVMVAVPLLGFGSQAHAGMLPVELPIRSADSNLLDSPSLGSEWWVEQPEVQSVPTITQASEPVADEAPLRQILGIASLSLAPSLPGVPAPTTDVVKDHRTQPIGFVSRATIPPAGLASLFLSGPRTQLPDPLLSSLFRPPR